MKMSLQVVWGQSDVRSHYDRKLLELDFQVNYYMLCALQLC